MEPAATDDDEVLLSKRDPSALGPIYRRYAKLIRDVARAILGSSDDAEDLAHEVFVSLCEHHAFDPRRGSVGAFLIAMTRSRALDRLRRRSRSRRLLEVWHAAAAPLQCPLRSPLDQVAASCAAQQLRAGIAELPIAQRRVLVLAYYQDRTQREISRDLATPLGTVKSLSRSGLSALGRLVVRGA